MMAFYRQYLGDPCNTILMLYSSTDPTLTTWINNGSQAPSLGPSLRIGPNHCGAGVGGQYPCGNPPAWVHPGMGLGDYISGDVVPDGDSYGFYWVYPHAVTLNGQPAPPTLPNCPGTKKGAVACQGVWKAIGLYGLYADTL
jgi:hypothetical protein